MRTVRVLDKDLGRGEFRVQDNTRKCRVVICIEHPKEIMPAPHILSIPVSALCMQNIFMIDTFKQHLGRHHR